MESSAPDLVVARPWPWLVGTIWEMKQLTGDIFVFVTMLLMKKVNIIEQRKELLFWV